jgi:hypothetical protein
LAVRIMGGKKVEREGGRIVHRGCTGNAERQWRGEFVRDGFPSAYKVHGLGKKFRGRGGMEDFMSGKSFGVSQFGRG